MARRDPYNLKETYLKWKGKALRNGIQGLTKANSDLILQYVADMEQGINVAPNNRKGSRSYIRLKVICSRLPYLAREFQKRFLVNEITQIDERQLCGFFSDMRNGNIKRANGKQYKAVRDYVKNFKAFWHWHQRVNRKEGKQIQDITTDLDTSGEKPDWVYLTEDQVKHLCSEARYDYEVLIWFLYDTGIRAPTELSNIKVSDFYNDFKELNIRDEISKTFGRRIKLMLCSDIIKEYVKRKNLSLQDYIFSTDYGSMNRYLKNLAKRVLGDKESPAGERYSQLTLYDFRHNSCCYWLPRYKSESALKYRFGWKSSDKIHYYSELLGMRDTISDEDMLIDKTKTEVEQKLEKSNNENSILKEQVIVMQSQLNKITKLTSKLFPDFESDG